MMQPLRQSSGQAYAEVIGDPIAHSKSPLIHNFWLQKLGIDAEYRATHVRPDELAEYFTRRRGDAAWRGCNVTIPHKLAVLNHVTDPGGVRASIGAANTVVRDEHDALVATNTDAAGFFSPIAEMAFDAGPVVVIGSGGAARAVLFALSKAGVAEVVMVARNPLKAGALMSMFGLKGHVQPLDRALLPAALLVNATQLGMVGQLPLELDLSPLPPHAVVYDLVYAPLMTPLLLAAEARGLAIVDGLEMLVGQAALAFELFFGQPAPREHDADLRALLTA
jgi:shikimate dehydrogenase